MDAKDIQSLIDFIANSGLDEVNIENGDFKLAIKKNAGVVQQVVTAAPAPAPAAAPTAAPAPAPAPAAPAAATPADAAPQGNTVEIKSPMIGTFYRRPNPDSDPFVSVGDEVKVGQAVCTIEAMKLFNEIESEVKGTIVKVLVDDAAPVQYDQPLFLVELS